MADFRGFASHDQAALKALLCFSYNTTVGNMDEAFRAIKAVRRCVQWEGHCTPLVSKLTGGIPSCCMQWPRGALTSAPLTVSVAAKRSGRTWLECVCARSALMWPWCV